jgi:hypothetical protein
MTTASEKMAALKELDILEQNLRKGFAPNQSRLNRIRAALSAPAPVSLKPETKAGIDVVREHIEAAERMVGFTTATDLVSERLQKALTALSSIEAGVGKETKKTSTYGCNGSCRTEKCNCMCGA